MLLFPKNLSRLTSIIRD